MNIGHLMSFATKSVVAVMFPQHHGLTTVIMLRHGCAWCERGQAREWRGGNNPFSAHLDNNWAKYDFALRDKISRGIFLNRIYAACPSLSL